MNERTPLVMIGLDAFEVSEMEELLAAGRLPHLARLRQRGRFVGLRCEPAGLLGAVWRDFVTGRPVWRHGQHFRKLWNPALGRVEPAEPDRDTLRPFWEELARRGARLALVDVPHAPAPPSEGVAGVFLNGWQCHDRAERAAAPEGLWAELERRFGPPRLGVEHYGPQTPARLLQVRSEAIATAGQAGAIGAWLLERERFDLFLMVLGAPHRAGHYLWDLSQIEADGLDAETLGLLEGGLHDCYVACDEALGRMLDAAPADARIGVFAVHGMGPSWGWTELFPDILRLLHDRASGGPPPPGLRHRLRRMLRSPLVLSATRLLPPALLRPLGRFWTARMHDWSRTRFFALPSELGGLVRINLQGREAQGIVAPGRDCEALLDRLTHDLLALQDLETGEPIVAAVERTDALVPPDAPARALLPDLCVLWGPRRIEDSIGIRAPGHGELRWPRGRKLESGRSGNHRAEGWLIAAGPGIAPSSRPGLASPLDLVASIRHALGMGEEADAGRQTRLLSPAERSMAAPRRKEPQARREVQSQGSGARTDWDG
jgi:predicted AlkP superfamily phosphohydrolase/phosphomutase